MAFAIASARLAHDWRDLAVVFLTADSHEPLLPCTLAKLSPSIHKHRGLR
jgi:hypothetical protein